MRSCCLSLVLATACSGISQRPDGDFGGGKKGPPSVTVTIEPGLGEEPWLAFRDGDVGWEHLDAGATRAVTAATFEISRSAQNSATTRSYTPGGRVANEDRGWAVTRRLYESADVACVSVDSVADSCHERRIR